MGSASSALRRLSLDDNGQFGPSDAAKLMKKFDRDGNGVLDKAEATKLFVAWAKACGVGEADVDGSVAAAVAHFDRDGDGLISLCELLNIPDAHAMFVAPGGKGGPETLDLSSGNRPEDIACVPGTELAVIAGSKGLHLIDAEKHELVHAIGESEDYDSVAVSASGKVFALRACQFLDIFADATSPGAGPEKTVDLSAGPINVQGGKGDPVKLEGVPVLAASDAGNEVVCVGRGGVVAVLDGDTGEARRSFAVSSDVAAEPTTAAVAGGNLLIGSSNDALHHKGITVVSLVDGAVVTQPGCPRGPINWACSAQNAPFFFVTDKYGSSDIDEFVLRVIANNGETEVMHAAATDIYDTDADKNFGWISAAACTAAGLVVSVSDYKKQVVFWK
jgi:EF hand